jgi:tetratricopeptide (TPR) repeat protein
MYKIEQSQSAFDKWVNFAFRARLNSFTKASAASSIVQGGRKRRDSSIKAFGDPRDEQGRSEAAIECLRKALRTTPDHTDEMLALQLQRENQYAEDIDYWRSILRLIAKVNGPTGHADR